MTLKLVHLTRRLVAFIAPACVALAALPGAAFAQCAAMTVTAHSPGWGTTVGSQIGPPLSVTFNYDLDPGSLIASGPYANVTLVNYNTNASIPITVSVSGKTVKIAPVTRLAANSYYRYVVKAGIKALPTASCGTPTYASSHGNNFYTGVAGDCPSSEAVVFSMGGTVTLNRACKYQIHTEYSMEENTYEIAFESGFRTGLFQVTRILNPNDMRGYKVDLANVKWDASANKWIAATATATGHDGDYFYTNGCACGVPQYAPNAPLYSGTNAIVAGTDNLVGTALIRRAIGGTWFTTYSATWAYAVPSN